MAGISSVATTPVQPQQPQQFQAPTFNDHDQDDKAQTQQAVTGAKSAGNANSTRGQNVDITA